MKPVDKHGMVTRNMWIERSIVWKGCTGTHEENKKKNDKDDKAMKR